MKTTEEYLYDLIDEISKIDINIKGFNYSRTILDLINKYATLIDAIKIITKQKNNGK